MPGYVYILTNRTMPGLVKIGSTKLTPDERAKQLHTTGVASPYTVYASRRFYDHAAAERRVHAILAPYRESAKREFFRRSPEVAEKVLDQVLSELGGPSSGWIAGIADAARTGLRSMVALGLGVALISYVGVWVNSAPAKSIPQIATKEVPSRRSAPAATDVGAPPKLVTETNTPLAIEPVKPFATDQSEDRPVDGDPPAPAAEIAPPNFELQLSAPPEETISVPDFAGWYSRDSKVADERFRGKLIRLKGTVVKARRQEIDFGLVHCQLNDALSVDLAAGQVVLVEGIVTGKRKKKKISVVGCDLLP